MRITLQDHVQEILRKWDIEKNNIPAVGNPVKAIIGGAGF